MASSAYLAWGCQARLPDPSSPSAEFSTKGSGSRDFCELSRRRDASPATAPLWNAARVQQEIRDLANAPDISGTPWAAYPTLYQAMTQARDHERCGGSLRTTNPLNRALNDRLADLMTRFYVLETRACAAKHAPDHAKHGLCQIAETIKTEHYDALSAAMASTAIYLSTNIAESLRAMIVTDEVWIATGEPDTMAANPELKLKARLEAMKRFKPTFDAFNLFLANHLGTVVGSLQTHDLVKGPALGWATNITRYLSFKTCLFAKVRNQAFDTAMSDSLEFGPRQHPMLREHGGRYEVSYDAYQFQIPPTPRAQKLEAFAIAAVAGPAQRLIYKKILGGKSWSELEKTDEKSDAQCAAP